MKKVLILLFAFGLLLVSYVNVGAAPLDNIEVADDVGIYHYTDVEKNTFDVSPIVEVYKSEIHKRQPIPILQNSNYLKRSIKHNGKKGFLKSKSPPHNSNIKLYLKNYQRQTANKFK